MILEAVDPEVRRLVEERVAKTSGLSQDLQRAEEIDRAIIAKGTNAVQALIAMAQRAANTDPLVRGRSQDYGNELWCPAHLLAEIGDRRAIPLFSALMRFATKPRRASTWLARLLCHGTDKEIQLDAQSRDPNVARVAQRILRYPEQYQHLKDGYRKRGTSVGFGRAANASQPLPSETNWVYRCEQMKAP